MSTSAVAAGLARVVIFVSQLASKSHIVVLIVYRDFD